MNELKKLVEFLADHQSRVTYHDRWLIVTQDDGTNSLDNRYTVYQRSYGKKKTVTLYDGNFLSEALLFLGGTK